MNHLDTFSGIGGWALAARWMGWNTVAFVEKEKFCHKVLNKNFPGVPIHDDIFTFSGKPFHGRVDILTGSTPCQPFSQAGKREGSNDERHLFPEFLRVVAEVEPRWIIIENVYGLLSIESGQVFEEYHAQLESKGYSVQTACIPASALNAPHRRDRLWIVAHTNGLGERTGCREIQSPNGKVCERHDDAEPRNSDSELRGQLTNPDSGRLERTETQGRNGLDVVRQDQSVNDTLNGEHRANGRPQSEADGIQGIGGAKGLSGRVSGAVTDVSAITDTSGRFGRQEQSEIRERQSDQGCGNDRPLSEFAVDHCGNAFGVPRNSKGTGQQSGFNGSREIEYGRTGSGLLGWGEHWTEVATRFCGMDARFSDWLDSDKGVDYAEITSRITRQDLPDLWKYFQSPQVWETIRSDYAIQDAENLFAVLRELERRSDNGGLSLESITASPIELRELRDDLRSGRPPQRREYSEQYNREHSDALSSLSHEIALATESAFQRFKVGTDTSDRVSRLKSLGNAIVPQIAFELFKAIEEVEKENR